MSINSHTKKNAGSTILFAWLLTGSLDILSALIDYYIRTGKGPEGVLRYIASGAFGNSAFTGGAIMIWSGLIFHYAIALLFTLFFFGIYPHLKFFNFNIILTAVVYGLFVWFVMNMFVVPFSNTPKLPFDITKALKAVLILICMIGLPLSIIMKRFFKPDNVTNGNV